MKKVTLIMITLIISMSLVNADETTTSTETGTTTEASTTTDATTTSATTEATTTSTEALDNSDVETKKAEIKKLKEEERAKIEANKLKMKENREAFKVERGTWIIKKIALSDETKAKIKEIMDAHKLSAEEIKASVASGSLTKEEGLKKLEELKTSTHESIKALVWDNEEAMRILGLKKDMHESNMEIRKDNAQIRQDFRQQRHDLKAKYKEKFVTALGTKLDKVSDEKLNKILTKIDVAIEKTTANEKLSQTNKDKILAQLDALKAIINEKLWVSEEETEVNVDELLAE